MMLALVLIVGAHVSSARADGDPASDYLVSRQVFLSAGSTTVSPSQSKLIGVVAAANRAGFPIRVAVIPTEYDLGSIIELWRKPQLYARFLGLELPYKQRLLVVMPNGYGFNWPGHPTAAAYAALEKLPVATAGSSLPGAAETAVMRLAAADGIKLAPAGGHPSTGRAASPADQAPWIAIAAAAFLAVAAFVLVRSRRRRGPAAPAPAAGPAVARRRLIPIPLRWALPGAGFLCAVAVATPILATSSHAGAVSSAAAGAIQTPPPFTWPAGRRRAPDFALRDQAGHPVSVAAYRGRPVLVTFVDPLCRNLCPLEAKVLNQVVSQMPVSQRPAILAVSVDVYANARSNLLQDVRKWELVPQWHWAVGRPAQLAAVWKRYAIGVSVVTKKIASTAINYITHTEAAYLVDATGHERALFLWPFYPQDVERTLRSLS
jgi:cytochrome oxidase Cu insertion factor (SCO1/SenC/PrrC family)